MPFKVNRKRTYRRKTYRKPYAKKSVAKTAKAVVRKLEPTREIRFTDGGALAGNVTPTNTFSSEIISAISLGDDLKSRTGPEIYVSGMKVDLVIMNRDFNSTRGFRFMCVKNRNPADTLDVVSYSDLYEGTNFQKYTPLGFGEEFHLPINRDVLKVIADKKFVVKPTSQGAVRCSFWIPIKQIWKYKTVYSSDNITTGTVYVICQAVDLSGVVLTSTCDFNWVGRLYFKNH